MPRPGYVQAPTHRAKRLLTEATRLHEQLMDITHFGDNPDSEWERRLLQWAGEAKDLMAHTNEYTEGARQAKALRTRAQQARNTLQGSPIDATPTAPGFPPETTRHEPVSGYHTHQHDDGGGGYHYHEHFHRGDNLHTPSRQPDHDAEGHYH